MPSERRRPQLSLDLLKGFEAAARGLSFTHAAQELSLTQSAVSREIKTLEDQLGEPCSPGLIVGCASPMPVRSFIAQSARH